LRKAAFDLYLDRLSRAFNEAADKETGGMEPHFHALAKRAMAALDRARHFHREGGNVMDAAMMADAAVAEAMRTAGAPIRAAMKDNNNIAAGSVYTELLLERIDANLALMAESQNTVKDALVTAFGPRPKPAPVFKVWDVTFSGTPSAPGRA
jgi:hypothetical protein